MTKRLFVNILFVVTDSYLLYACPLIKSIVDNSNHHVNFHFIGPDFTKKNKKIIDNYVYNLGGCTSFYLCACESFNDFYQTDRYPSFLYAKMVPHIYLPTNLDRILGLDIDTLVMGNIDEFYFMEFNSNLLYACYNKRTLRNLILSKDDNIFFQNGFNGGVILYNLMLFNQNITIDTYKSWLREYTNQGGQQQQFEEWIMANTLRNKYDLKMPFDYNYNISAVCLYEEFCHINKITPLKKIIHFQDPNNKKPWEYYDHFILGSQDSITEYPYYEYYKQWWNIAKDLPNEILEYYRDGSFNK